MSRQFLILDSFDFIKLNLNWCSDMKEIKLTFFAISTSAGMELVDLLKQVFANERPAGLTVRMETVVDGDQEDMTIAGLRDEEGESKRSNAE